MSHRSPGEPDTVEGRLNIGINQEKYQSGSQGHHGREQDQITQILNLEEFDPEVVPPMNRIMTFV
jgi:hypothetical protein